MIDRLLTIRSIRLTSVTPSNVRTDGGACMHLRAAARMTPRYCTARWRCPYSATCIHIWDLTVSQRYSKSGLEYADPSQPYSKSGIEYGATAPPTTARASGGCSCARAERACERMAGPAPPRVTPRAPRMGRSPPPPSPSCFRTRRRTADRGRGARRSPLQTPASHILKKRLEFRF